MASFLYNTCNFALHVIHIGKNMMHCWPMLGFTKEGKKTRADIYKIIKSIWLCFFIIDEFLDGRVGYEILWVWQYK